MPNLFEDLKSCVEKIFSPAPPQKVIGYYKYNAILVFDCFSKQIIKRELDKDSPSTIVTKEEADKISEIKEWVLNNNNKNIHTFRFSWVEEIPAINHAQGQIPQPKYPDGIPQILIITPEGIEKRLGNQIRCPKCYKLTPCTSSQGMTTEGGEKIVCFDFELNLNYKKIRYPKYRIIYPPSVLEKRAVLLYNCYSFARLTENIINPIYPDVNDCLLIASDNCDSCQSDALLALTSCGSTFNQPITSIEYANLVRFGHISVYRMAIEHPLFTDPLQRIELEKNGYSFSVVDDRPLGPNGEKDKKCKTAALIINPPKNLLNMNTFAKIEYANINEIKPVMKSTPLWPMRNILSVPITEANYFPDFLRIQNVKCNECPVEEKVIINTITPDRGMIDQNAVTITVKGQNLNSEKIKQIQIGSLVYSTEVQAVREFFVRQTNKEMIIEIPPTDRARGLAVNVFGHPIELKGENGIIIARSKNLIITVPPPDLIIEDLKETSDIKMTIINGRKIYCRKREFKLTGFTSIKKVLIDGVVISQDDIEWTPTTNLKVCIQLSIAAQGNRKQKIEVINGDDRSRSLEFESTQNIKVHEVSVLEYRGCNPTTFEKFLKDALGKVELKIEDLFPIPAFYYILDSGNELTKFQTEFNAGKFYFMTNPSRLYLVKIERINSATISFDPKMDIFIIKHDGIMNHKGFFITPIEAICKHSGSLSISCD